MKNEDFTLFMKVVEKSLATYGDCNIVHFNEKNEDKTVRVTSLEEAKQAWLKFRIQNI